jgi:hypothetical protein
MSVRKQKRLERQSAHLEQIGRTVLSPQDHLKRMQIAGMTGLDLSSLNRMSAQQVTRVHDVLVKRQMEVIAGSLICVTKLMGSLVVEPAVRDGVEGTLIRVTVAAEAETFQPRTREIAGELLQRAVTAVSNVGTEGSEEQQVLRTKFAGSLSYDRMNKAHGARDLRSLGVAKVTSCERPVERVAQASLALERLMKEPDSRFTPFVDELEEQLEEELEEQRTVAEEGRASNNGSFKSADSRAVSPQICTEVLISIS